MKKTLITNKDLNINVVGLGFVGLTLSVVAAKKATQCMGLIIMKKY